MNPNHSDALGRTTLNRIASLRATMRRRLLAYGMCVVFAGGVLALLTTVALDWAMHLPGILRLIVTAGFLLGGAFAIVYWVVRPLTTPITPLAIARYLEQRFPHLSDRISSAVAFLSDGAAGSSLMRDQVVRNADIIMRKLPTRQILSVRYVYTGLVVLAVSTVALTSVVTSDSNWLRFGVSRYLHPLGDLRWPNRVEIVPLTGDRMVAGGDALTFQMRIVRGQSTRTRALVQMQRTDGSISVLVMSRQNDGSFSCRIDNVSHPFRYWFEAGDDSTVDRSGEVTIVKPPHVVDVRADVHPPPYAASERIKKFDSAVGPIEAVPTSQIDITARFSKPIASDVKPTDQPVLLIKDGQAVPLLASADEPAVLSATLIAQEDCTFRFRVVDRAGFTNRSARWYAIRVRPDQPPVVTIDKPTGALERTPAAAVSIAFEVRDDWGIRDVALETSLESESSTWKTYWSDAITSNASGSDEVNSKSVSLRLADLNVAPPATVLWRVRAVDNSPGGGQIGFSPPMRIHIIDEAERDHRNRSALVLLEADLRSARERQKHIAEQTAPMVREIQSDQPIDSTTLAKIAADQRQMIREVQDILAGFDRVVSQAGGDDASATQMREQIEQAARRLQLAQKRLIETAAQQLDMAQRQSDTDKVVEAHAKQQQAVLALSETLSQLGEWGDFQQIVTRTQNLFDRQQTLRQATRAHHAETVGRAVDRLTAKQRQTLLQLNEGQNELAQDAATLLNKMRSVADALRQLDPPTAMVLDNALRAASAASLVQNMRDAAYAVGQNRNMTAAATQRQAENGLVQMQAALSEQRQRKLQHLARQLEQHEQTIAEWINQQRQLITANEEFIATRSDATAFGPLATRQSRLEQNVRSAIRDWRGTEQLDAIEDTLNQSASAMSDAAEQLLQAQGANSVARQMKARDTLMLAHRRLLAMSQKARDESRKLQVIAMRTKLDRIRNRQRETNATTEKLIATAQAAKRLNRRIARSATSMARDQHALHTDVTELRDKLDSAMVYDFVLRRATDAMDRAVDLLSSRKLGAPLAEAQSEALSDLDLLVRALDDMLHMPAADEYERGGGGGGGGSNQDLPSVPALAELLVLKSMQTALNEKTRAASADLEIDAVTESSLQQVRRLATEQNRIHTLTQEVVNRAHANTK